MARALQLAERGLYTTEPNPRVGCVLVRDDTVIGEGYHIRAGEGHAEVNALAAAAGDASGATAYVTLEPCSHHGRTGPCAEALLRAGVRRVVSAMTDPNPLVAGRGHRLLEAAGVEVATGLLQAQAEALNPGFISRMQRGRPWVRIKQAMSLDGRTAMASGESQWITGPAARRDVQRLRARSSAIITGIGSVLQDDPALTLREAELGLAQAAEVVRRQPLRVVLDSALQIPLDARILRQPEEVLVCCAQADATKQQALQALGVTLCVLPAAGGRIDLPALLAYLAAERQCNEVLVETGAVLAGAFLRAGLADELWLYQAPKLLGSQARPLFELPFSRMAEQLELDIIDARAVGEDWRLIARPRTTLAAATEKG